MKVFTFYIPAILIFVSLTQAQVKPQQETDFRESYQFRSYTEYQARHLNSEENSAEPQKPADFRSNEEQNGSNPYFTSKKLFNCHPNPFARSRLTFLLPGFFYYSGVLRHA